MAWTVRYCSTLAGGGGTGTTEADPWTQAEWVTNHTAGMHGYFKADGTYTGLTMSVNGTDTQWIWIEAYDSVPGDGGKATISLIQSTGYNTIIQGFKATTSNAHAIRAYGNHSIVIDCEGTLESSSSNWNAALGLQGGATAISCAFKAATSGSAEAAFWQNTGPASLVGCSIKSANNVGSARIQGTSGSRFFAGIGNILECDGTARGFYSNAGGAHSYIGNTIYNMTSALEQALAGTSDTNIQLAINNLIDNCTNGIVASTSNKTGMTVANNSIGRITSNRYDLGDTPIFGDQVHTADPFRDSANGDYVLNHDSDGGEVPRQSGLEATRG